MPGHVLSAHLSSLDVPKMPSRFPKEEQSPRVDSIVGTSSSRSRVRVSGDRSSSGTTSETHPCSSCNIVQRRQQHACRCKQFALPEGSGFFREASKASSMLRSPSRRQTRVRRVVACAALVLCIGSRYTRDKPLDQARLACREGI